MKYECHGHIILDGVDYRGAIKRHRNGPDEDFIRKNLRILKEHNIVFYRDGGDNLLVSVFAKKLAHEYGIDYRTPCYAIHKRSYYGAMFGRCFDSMKDMKKLITGARDLGADFIKLMVSGIMDFKADGSVSGPALTPAEIKEAVNIAEGEGLSVMAHVNGPVNVKNALESGVKSIEHGFWMDRDAIDIFLQTGAVWVPTISPVRNLMDCGRYSYEVIENILNNRKNVLVDAYRQGVPVASGSDSGSFMVYQGKGTDDEYAYLEELGIKSERGNMLISEMFKKA